MSDSLLAGPVPATDGSPKRRQVLDAAGELFLAHGYGAVSMDAVARAAGVSKATLYAYFASKDALFATMIRECGLNNRLDGSMFPDRVDDLRAALEVLGLRILRFMLQEQTLATYRIVVAESARFPELGVAFYENGPAMFLARAREWVATQQARGLVRAADVAVAAQQFMALLRSGLFLRASLAVPPAATEAEIVASVKAAVETWLRAFGADARAEAGFAAPADCA